MLEHKNWKQKLLKVLRNYRATSHTITEKSPSDLVIICYNKVIKLWLESDKTILYLTIVQILI